MKQDKSRRGLSQLETVALCIFVSAFAVATTATLTRWRFEEKYVIAAEPLKHELKARYGPDQFSQFGEEWIIRDFFQDRRAGVFLDVGSSHHRIFNNTYFLEKILGWSGIAVDALQEYGEGYVTNRPATRFVAMFASDVQDSSVEFFVAENPQVSSSSAAFSGRGGATSARQVPTTTLNALLDDARIQKVDFLSMDIELAEPKALAGFDIKRFRPDLVCIEFSGPVRQQILDYFFQHGYVVVGKYARVDPHNIYFKPFTP